MRRGSPVSLSTAVFVVAVITAVGVGIRAKVVARQAKVPFPEVKDLSTVKIKLRRTICFGTCPSYKVEVDGSGLVIFEGYEFVAIPGRHTVRVPESSVRALIEAFRQADYFSAEDAYEVAVTDVPTYVTALAMDGREKQVVDYFGAKAGMPDGIRTVEQKIDEIAGTARWIKAKDDDALTVLDAEGWDFRSTGADNMAIYSSAIENRNLALLRRYLDTGAPVAAPPLSGPSPLCIASQQGDIGLVKRMIHSNMTLERACPKKRSIPMRVMNQCLGAAAEAGDLPMLQSWLDQGADPTLQAENTLPNDSKRELRPAPMTLLTEAILSRKAAIVTKVLEYKVDMTPPAGDDSLLEFALRVSSVDTPGIVESLLKEGGDVNRRGAFLHQTPLFDAYAAPGAVKLLLDAGADIEARDDNGNTPLIRGAMVEPMVRELLVHGASPHAVAKNGDTALKVAKKFGCVACVSLLEAAMK